METPLGADAGQSIGVCRNLRAADRNQLTTHLQDAEVCSLSAYAIGRPSHLSECTKGRAGCEFNWPGDYDGNDCPDGHGLRVDLS